MADYTDSKPGIGALIPEGATEQGLRRMEPLLTPTQLVERHLFGIPLVSAVKNPFTGKAQIMTEEMVKDVIDRSISMLEMDSSLSIFPNQITEKLEFDRQAFQSWGYMQLNQKPVASLESLQIVPANGTSIYTVNKEWIETSALHRGQVTVIPMGAAIAGGVAPSGTLGGSAFLAVLGHQHWIPSYWQAVYTTGFVDGMMPKIINEIIGVYAAIEILSQLSATNAQANSHSLGIDGLSQSSSGPGADKYTKRVEQLEGKKTALLKKIKVLFGQSIISSHV